MKRTTRIAFGILAGEYAACGYCGKTMHGHGCKRHWYVMDGVRYEAVKFGDPMEKLPPDMTICHDRGVEPGDYRHPGCNMERRPKCGRRLTGFHGCHVSDMVEFED